MSEPTVESGHDEPRRDDDERALATETTHTETTEDTESTVEIPDNDDVDPGREPLPRSDREGGEQDDGSDPVPEDEQERGDDEPDDGGHE